MYNRVVIVGRVCSLPLSKGLPEHYITRFNIVIGYKSKGKLERDVFTVECWNALAKNAEIFANIGRLVLIEGRLRTNAFKKRNKQIERTVFIGATSIVYLDKLDVDDDTYKALKALEFMDNGFDLERYKEIELEDEFLEEIPKDKLIKY